MILPPQEGKEFFGILMPLLRWVKKTKGAKAAIREAKKKHPQKFMEESTLLGVIWNRPELIDRYLAQKNAVLSESDRSVLLQWRRFFVYGTFIIERFSKSGAIFISAHDGKTYLVSGITSEIEESLNKKALPCLVDTALLPFKGRIVYDSAMLSVPNIIDKEGAKELAKVYQEAHRKGQIIESLPSDVPPPDANRWEKCIEAITPSILEQVAEAAAERAEAGEGNTMDDFKRELANNPNIHMITQEQAATLERLMGQPRRSDAEWDVIKDILYDIHVVTATPIQKGTKVKSVNHILCEDGDLLVYTTMEKCQEHMQKLFQKDSRLRFCEYTFLPCEEVFDIAHDHKLKAFIDRPEDRTKKRLREHPEELFDLCLMYDGKAERISASLMLPTR